MVNSIKRPWKGDLLDGIAIGGSATCLIHCLGVPVIIALAPAVSAVAAIPHWFHLMAFVIALPASGLAILSGYRRHGVILPAVIAVMGLILIGLGALGGFRLVMETGLTVAGSLVLATAHLGNWRLRRSRQRQVSPAASSI